VLAYRKGVDLMVVRGKWYLAIVCNVPDPEKVGLPGCSRRGSRRHQRSSRATPGELVRISIGKTNRKARQAFSSTRRRLCWVRTIRAFGAALLTKAPQARPLGVRRRVCAARARGLSG
jgi:hypothetical protein